MITKEKPDCGCKVIRIVPKQEIEYCPIHAVAPELVQIPMSVIDLHRRGCFITDDPVRAMHIRNLVEFSFDMLAKAGVKLEEAEENKKKV